MYEPGGLERMPGAAELGTVSDGEHGTEKCLRRVLGALW